MILKIHVARIRATKEIFVLRSHLYTFRRRAKTKPNFVDKLLLAILTYSAFVNEGCGRGLQPTPLLQKAIETMAVRI